MSQSELITGGWLAEERLQREQGSSNGESRGPFLAENVETDRPSLRGNVGVPDLRVELHLAS